jgi:3-oxoacyl-[acyl-carrier-protein] synthase III
MVMISAQASVVPPLEAIEGAVSRTRSSAYMYLYEPSARDAVPFSRQDLVYAFKAETPVYSLHEPLSGIRAPVADGKTSAASLVIQACRTLADRVGREELAKVHQIIFCHDTIDEATAGSTASAIQSALELPHALPISLAQFSNCSVFLAFEFAAAFADATGGSTLVAASDKWIFPFLRGFGPHACFGDAGAAVLLAPGDPPGAEIVSAVTRRSDRDIRAHGSTPFPSQPTFAHEVAETIAECLVAAELSPRDVDVVVPQGFSPVCRSAVRRLSGLDHAPEAFERNHGAHLANADTLCGLDGLLGPDAQLFQTALLWGAGMNGETAAAIVRRVGHSSEPKGGRA